MHCDIHIKNYKLHLSTISNTKLCIYQIHNSWTAQLNLQSKSHVVLKANSNPCQTPTKLPIKDEVLPQDFSKHNCQEPIPGLRYQFSYSFLTTFWTVGWASKWHLFGKFQNSFDTAELQLFSFGTTKSQVACYGSKAKKIYPLLLGNYISLKCHLFCFLFNLKVYSISETSWYTFSLFLFFCVWFMRIG